VNRERVAHRLVQRGVEWCGQRDVHVERVGREVDRLQRKALQRGLPQFFEFRVQRDRCKGYGQGRRTALCSPLGAMCPPSIRFGQASRSTAAVDRGQSLVACPLLDVALELFRRCRWFALWMPNDPYDLAYAPAPTASRGSPVGGGRGVAVRAAAVTDHVRDNWYGPAPSRASMPGMEGAHSRLGERLHAICRIRQRSDA
jgi:hypothetical protein